MWQAPAHDTGSSQCRGSWRSFQASTFWRSASGANRCSGADCHSSHIRLLANNQTSYLDYSSPYLQKVIDAGGWAKYERLHLDKLTAMLTPKDQTDGRRRSRRRLSPLRRLPPEVLRRIVAYAFHAGYY